MKPKKHPPLFRYIQDLQGDEPWGNVLDAGTGVQSLRWITDLPTKRWTAISASPLHAQRVRDIIKDSQRPQDQIIVGNWVNGDMLKGDIYETVIADYLLGAIEGFSPYFQPYLFQRLRQHNRGRIYVKGLEPYVPTARPETPAGQILWEIGRFRDACVLLGGDVPYREYPAQWVRDQLRIAGYKVSTIKHFKARHKAKFVNAQIDLCLPGLKKLPDPKLAEQLITYGNSLRAKALALIEAEGALSHGHNYVIMAKTKP